MKSMFAFTRTEVVTTAIVVMPTMLMWIISERFVLALLTGCTTYGIYRMTDADRRDRALVSIRDLFGRAQTYVRARTTRQA